MDGERAIDSSLSTGIDFVPHAIVKEGIARLVARYGGKVVASIDDLDRFRGSTVIVGLGPVALRKYAGHARGTTTIYFPSDVAGREAITRKLDETLRLLRVPDSKVQWRRFSSSTGPVSKREETSDASKHDRPRA